jgi:hypothetical protein
LIDVIGKLSVCLSKRIEYSSVKAKKSVDVLFVLAAADAGSTKRMLVIGQLSEPSLVL